MRAGSPLLISATLAVVPPTSSPTASMPPSWRTTWAAAYTPATGPDSSIRTGKRDEVSVVAIPPDDSMTYIRRW